MTTTHSNLAHAEKTNNNYLTTHITTRGEHGDAHASASIFTQEKLTNTGIITPNTLTTTLTTLQIDVQDQDGNAITQFDQFQKQITHLIAVSDDLRIVQHLHPIYEGNGRFEVETQFPQSGNYILFSDYQPTGHTNHDTSVSRDSLSMALLDNTTLRP